LNGSSLLLWCSSRIMREMVTNCRLHLPIWACIFNTRIMVIMRGMVIRRTVLHNTIHCPKKFY
jgi:hypothetical protein